MCARMSRLQESAHCFHPRKPHPYGTNIIEKAPLGRKTRSKLDRDSLSEIEPKSASEVGTDLCSNLRQNEKVVWEFRPCWERMVLTLFASGWQSFGPQFMKNIKINPCMEKMDRYFLLESLSSALPKGEMYWKGFTSSDEGTRSRRQNKWWV